MEKNISAHVHVIRDRDISRDCKMTGFVDSHFHIWDLKKFHYDWPTENEAAIFKNITLDELLKEVTSANKVKYGVFVQCLNDKPEEAKWVMQLAESTDFIKGVVAGVALNNPNLSEVLDDLQKNPLFKGLRHILDFEDENWLTREDVHKGFKVLEDRGLTFDLLLR
ncbi:hypothetical protein KUTeg_021705 [Tegillarca granosa]|uniref:Amidohydrolase n=1 Tax=Tegillarca granosa TaxID=220873 RepID=A0ABQ9E448_TEGGR|nr:hypothetical protein KUTeg_021705 [Tegillarca granosa]